MISHLITFLFGAATGAAATYFGNKFTDQRRKREARKEARKQFNKIRNMMPELISEMKADLTKEGKEFIRDFYLLSKKWTFWADENCFVYYFEDHQDLQGKINILENHGYVMDVTPKEAKKYRMTEEFVELVREK